MIPSSKSRKNEEKLVILGKQLEANEKHKSEYLKRYEDAVVDTQKNSNDFSGRIANLWSKCSTLEERYLSLSKDVDLARQESSDWKIKYKQSCLKLKAEEANFITQKAAVESKYSVSEGRLAAAREQAASAQEEALEWKQKYETITAQVKTALERAASLQEVTNRKAQEREDAIRAEFASQLEEKGEEVKNLNAKLEQTEGHTSIVVARLEELKMQSHDMEAVALKDEIKNLNEKFDFEKDRAQSYEQEGRILEQEKNHLQENYLSQCKKFGRRDHPADRDASDERDATAGPSERRVMQVRSTSTPSISPSPSSPTTPPPPSLPTAAVAVLELWTCLEAMTWKGSNKFCS